MQSRRSPRERLVHHVQRLEELERAKVEASDALRDAFNVARVDGFDTATLRVVLKLRKMTPEERKQQRALVAIYLAALGMLEGDPLTDEARRRLDERPSEGPTRPTPAPAAKTPAGKPAPAPAAPPPPQAELPLKEPDEARKEGGVAAAAGKRIYDNPYPSSDRCRAAWDEGWCAQSKSHGMDPPAAYQRRTPPKPPDEGKGAGDGDARGAA